MKTVVENIEKWVNDQLADQEDLFLVDIIKKGNSDVAKVVILIDGDNGVPIEKCVEISRNISRRIDEEMELIDPLTYEVSSPGLDHPLKFQRQYVKNIGKSLSITLNDKSQTEGKITSVQDNSVELEIVLDKKKKKTELKSFDFKDINKAIILVSFK
ncbi:MAG: ribosome maturation factor RimP [Reichenbachiella sp.]